MSNIAIIYTHGFLSSPQGTKGQFLEKMCNSLSLEFHGVDLSPTPKDFRNMTVPSMLQTMTKTIQKTGDARLILIGSSLGGYLSILYAQQHLDLVKALILFAPAIQIGQYYNHKELQNWKKSGSKPIGVPKFDNAVVNLKYDFVQSLRNNTIKDLPLPSNILIFQGSQDPVVKPQDIKKFAKKHGAELVLLKSDHRLHDKLLIMGEKIRKFLKDQITQ